MGQSGPDATMQSVLLGGTLLLRIRLSELEATAATEAREGFESAFPVTVSPAHVIADELQNI